MLTNGPTVCCQSSASLLIVNGHVHAARRTTLSASRASFREVVSHHCCPSSSIAAAAPGTAKLSYCYLRVITSSMKLCPLTGYRLMVTNIYVHVGTTIQEIDSNGFDRNLYS